MRNENRPALRALRSGPRTLEERYALNHIGFRASLEAKAERPRPKGKIAIDLKSEY
jgi:hypothetical protein